MITRRRVLNLGGAAALWNSLPPSISAFAAAGEPELTEDGLYRQPWFIESFLELGDDLMAAQQVGKRFAILWELKGCPYCKETHFVNFARAEIRDFVKSNFAILQLNIIGSRIVKDFDGRSHSEKDLAQKYGVRFTPTVQFFPPAPDGLANKEPKDREVARASGYLAPDHFLKMFRFVHGEAYEHTTFRKYLKEGV